MKRIMVLALACLLMPLVALGQQPPRAAQAGGGGGTGKWWKNSATIRALDLSDAQAMQLEAIYMQHQVRLAELRSALLQDEEQLRALLEAEQLNEAALSLQRTRIATTRTELENENSEMTLGMRRLMTAGQWRVLEKLRQSNSPYPVPLPAPVPGRVDDKSDETVYDLKATPEISPPTPVNTPRVAYTPEARAAKVEGIIVMQAIVQKDGSVSDVKVLRGLGYGLDEAAVESVRKSWRFQPPLLNGRPVKTLVNIEMSFRLY